MLRRPHRVLTVVVLGLMLAPTLVAATWTVHLHRHHQHGRLQHGEAPLQIALHGHAHDDDTPPHEHAFTLNPNAPVPARWVVPAPSVIGNAPEAVVPTAGCPRLTAVAGPGHDPPPTVEAPAILRI